MDNIMDRLYFNLIRHHLEHWSQMVFLEGPRQAGKTTLAKQLLSSYNHGKYLNWDNIEDRALMLSGQNFIEKLNLLNIASSQKPLVVFDEIHKFPDWKNYLKGFYDSYKDKLKIIATGSAKLSVYKKGQDSLMGRYFSYLIHPFSLREVTNITIDSDKMIQDPCEIDNEVFSNLYKYGGFPDPYLQSNNVFYNRWKNLRFEQLFREDIKNIEDVKHIGQLEVLAHILSSEATQQVNYSSLSRRIQVSDQTVRKWIEMLELFYFGYNIRPWNKNVARSILKEPKFYLWDWSAIESVGAKAENFIANHLKKATRLWSDMGLGDCQLYYLRTKDSKEVDFLVSKDRQPWFLVEVKTSNNSSLNKNLYSFQEQTQAKHAFQVVIDMNFEPINCFCFNDPIIVPAKTFLSQLP